MALLFRRFIGVLFTVALATLFSPFLSGLFEQWGWLNDPASKLTLAVEWMSNLAGHYSFALVAGGVIGLAFGVYLDKIMRVLDGKYPVTKSQKAKRFGGQALYLALRIENALGYRQQSEYQMLASEAQILLRKIEAIGVDIPQEIGRNAPVDNLADLLTKVGQWLKFVSPILSEGDMRLLR